LMDDYPYELGWVTIHPDFRNGRALLHLGLTVEKMLRGVSGIWATTRKEHMVIHKLLERGGFYMIGDDWVGKSGNRLVLFVRD